MYVNGQVPTADGGSTVSEPASGPPGGRQSPVQTPQVPKSGGTFRKL